jgi:hypothetical protein
MPAARVPGVRVVSVGDREADFYELFARARTDPCDAGLLVRTVHNRTLPEGCLGLNGWVAARPPSMRQAVIWIGRLGGCITRPEDYLPGAVTRWRGLITLQAMAAGWRLALGLELPERP